jgi:hypothetical protein
VRRGRFALDVPPEAAYCPLVPSGRPAIEPDASPEGDRRSGPELLAELDRLRAENAAKTAEVEALRKAPTGQITCKVSQKGAVSAYGLGRFPVTLYASQWARLFAHVESIGEFIEANKASLAVKGSPGQN